MEFFVDTAEIDEIRELTQSGLVDGVTTNPSLILKSGREMKELMQEICSSVNGPVSAEVSALGAVDMISEGIELSKIAKNITVKLPLTWDGLKACKSLSTRGIAVNVTLCFSANQAILAAKAGATYVSPFVGRLDDINLDGMELIKNIKLIFNNYNFSTKILAASIRSVNQISQNALVGTDIVTVPPSVFKKLVEHPLTKKGLETFTHDWEQTGQKII